ncbi:MAG: TorF family putative porin [Desulfuromonadales bacterium]|nr:TorF family putative porin [Desulfuromonadales bacterium]
MKKVMVAFALVLSMVAVSSPAKAAIEVEGDVYAGVYSEYLWRGFGLSGSMPVAQAGMDISFKGFTLSYWTNVQLKSDSGEGFRSGEATENDFVIDYTLDVNDLVSVSVGNIYYMLDGDYADLPDTNELYLGVALNTLLEPALTIYYDWDEAEENGLFYTASIGHSHDLAEGLSLSLGALVSYNDESDYSVGDYSDWHNYELSAGIDYALTDQISISPTLLFSSGISDESKDVIDSEFVYGIAATLTF